VQSDKDPEKRRQHYANRAAATVNKKNVQDIWNIRSGKNRKNFVYSGRAADIIMFCQPKLLNRGLKFSNQEKS